MLKRGMAAMGLLGALAVLVVGAFLWSPAGGASARGGDSDDPVRWGDWWLIPGVFEAEGDGIAAGAGKLDLKLCAEEGLLLVKRGDSEIAVESYDDKVEWLGLEVYFGFHGCAEIGGWGVAALAVGQGLTMRAEGLGIAYLAGEGTWAKDGGDSGEWREEGKIYFIGSKSRTAKTPTPEATEKPDEEPTDEPTKTPGPEEM